MILKNNKRIDGCSDTVPIGTLNPFLGSTAPYGYLICQGQKVSKTTYKKLYEICGDTFGQSTATEFYLPDLRGQTIAGYKEGDSTFGTLGGLIGSLTHLHDFSHTHNVPGVAHAHSTGNHTLTVNEIPSHSHMVYRGTNGTDYFGLTGKEPNGNTPYAVDTTATGGSQPHNHGDTGSTTPSTTTTNSQSKTNTSSVSNIQPTITLNWIVKAFQLMPNQSYVSTVKQDSDTNTYSCDYINNNLPFIAIYGETSYDDIVTAHEAGKTVIALRDEYQYQLYSVGSSRCVFGTIYELTSKFLIVTSDDIWSYDTEKLQKNLVFNTTYDKINNKVATMADTLNTYSTEEQIVGTFVNGKPVYRKTFVGQYTDGDVLLSDVNDIVLCSGSISISGIYRLVPYYEEYNGQKYIGTIRKVQGTTNLVISIMSEGQSSSANTSITIEYTKTTD